MMIGKLPVLCVLASLLLLVGCGSSNNQCPACTRLSAENVRLQRQITEKDRQIDNFRAKSGYLVIATWVAVLSAFGLLAVGIAVGVKIKDEIITLKDVKSADKTG